MTKKLKALVYYNGLQTTRTKGVVVKLKEAGYTVEEMDSQQDSNKLRGDSFDFMIVDEWSAVQSTGGL